jgi:hypothetical protein
MRCGDPNRSEHLQSTDPNRDKRLSKTRAPIDTYSFKQTCPYQDEPPAHQKFEPIVRCVHQKRDDAETNIDRGIRVARMCVDISLRFVVAPVSIRIRTLQMPASTGTYVGHTSRWELVSFRCLFGRNLQNVERIRIHGSRRLSQKEFR